MLSMFSMSACWGHGTVRLADGLAVKLNVRGGGSALHTHTNGTHAMMLFDDDTEDEDTANNAITTTHPHSRRDFLPTENHYYEFHDAAVHGFKVQAHNINAPKGAKYAKDYTKAVTMFAQYHSALVNNNQPAMSNSDRWIFQFCDKRGTESYFYGMIIAEERNAGSGYEHMSAPGCYQGGKV